MNCERVEQLLSEQQDGCIAASEARAMEAHLGQCPACRRRQAEFAAIRSRLRALAPQLPLLEADLSHRAIGRWLAERGASHGAGWRWSWLAPPPFIRVRALRGLGLAGAVAVLLLAVLAFHWRGHGPVARPHLPEVAIKPHGDSTPPAPHSAPQAPKHGAGMQIVNLPSTSPGAPGRNRLYSDIAPPTDHKNNARGKSSSTTLRPHRGHFGEDMTYLNGDPVVESRRWVTLRPDERARIEAKVRRDVRVRDDFVTIPFPLLASTSDRQIAEAVDSYKREAAITDPRLVREVTCAFKATALSDLCRQLRSDTGIDLTAGPSVADEKVTLFCEKLPLRDVMRQLSRPFGYTWLRSGRPSPAGGGAGGRGYRYELVQDLRSQLLEEELRNQDRDAALLDLDKEIDRYRPYLSLSPDEALARSKTAPPEQKRLLETYAGWGWGPLQLYARLSAQDQAKLRAGQTISFSGDPHRIARDGCEPLSPDLERGVLESMRDVRVRRPNGQTPPGDQPGIGSAQDLPDGVPPTASPEANGFVVLRISHTELGQFTFDGASGVTVGNYITVRGHDGDLGRGVSPAVQDPNNEIANARLAHDPTLERPVAVAPAASSPLPDTSREPGSGGQAAQEKRVTTADVLEALHRASGLPLVADFYTHLYPRTSVSLHAHPLFHALNQLADAMHMRWHKDESWLQFRTVSYYDDRVKEVPNRLLSRWAAARREHDGLPLDDLIEMAQLSDAQLGSSFVGEGVKERWGLEEWSLAQNRDGRPQLRYLAQLTPAQRQLAMSAQGLPFSRLSLAQQQGLIAHLGERLHSLGELAGSTVRVEYSEPGEFRWPAINWQPPSDQPNLFGLAKVREPTRAAALAAARRLDAGVSEPQIAPTDLSLTVAYTLIDPKTGKERELGVRAHGDGALISW